MKIAIIIYLAIGVIVMLLTTGIATQANIIDETFKANSPKGKIGLVLLIISTLCSNFGIILTWPLVTIFAGLGMWLTDED